MALVSWRGVAAHLLMELSEGGRLLRHLCFEVTQLGLSVVVEACGFVGCGGEQREERT